jgi:hypothetical protein
MADTTITGLPNATTPLSGAERVAMDQGSTTVDATTADIAATLPEATTSAPGKMSAADKTKLNGITGTNTGDQAIASTSDATSHTVTLSASGGSLRLVEGANITLTTSGTPEAAVVTVASTASGGSGATNLSYTVATRVLASDTGTDVTLPLVTTGNAGLAPASGGGTANFLRADGAWAAPASGSGGTKTLARFTPRDNQPPASDFATLDTRNSISVLEFNASTEETAMFVGSIPEGANLASGLLVRIWWMGDTATSGNVRWAAAFEDTGTDLDADSFDTATEVTSAANGTSGIETVASITCTTIDSLAAGDRFRLRIARKGADAVNDTMLGDAQVVAVEVRGVA